MARNWTSGAAFFGGGIFVVVTCGLFAGIPRAAVALETDQFTVPPAPLADLGPELAAEVMLQIDRAVDSVNARAAGHARKAEAARGFWRRHHLRAAQAELSETRLAREVYARLAGPAVPECRIERWVRTNRFAHQPARFEMSCGRSAYGASPFARSPLIMSLSPTVNAFGTHCGVDKIGHIFQQGYEYFDHYTRRMARRHGDAGEVEAEAEALAAVVKHGVGQERGFFGLALVGVYSNADLAANYAGFKLYLNLTRPVRVGTTVRPALFVLRDGRRWERNPQNSAQPRKVASVDGAAFLRPFFSDHLNESLNPSRYGNLTRSTIRSNWRARAGAWAAFYRTTRHAEADRVQLLATWHGEPYGHSGFALLVTAADTCFRGDVVHVRQAARIDPRTSAPLASGSDRRR